MKAEKIPSKTSDTIGAQGIPTQVVTREEIGTMPLEVPPRPPVIGTPISPKTPAIPSAPAPPKETERPVTQEATPEPPKPPRPPRGRKDAATTCVYFRDADQCDAMKKLCTRNGGSMSAVIQQLSQGLLDASVKMEPGQRLVRVTVDIFI